MTQVVGYLPNKLEALSSNPSSEKKLLVILSPLHFRIDLSISGTNPAGNLMGLA
jgi:hypothetical protein